MILNSEGSGYAIEGDGYIVDLNPIRLIEGVGLCVDVRPMDGWDG